MRPPRGPDVPRESARAAGEALGVDWGVVPLPTWQEALGVELEHGSALGPATDVTGDDLVTTGRIALAHLSEDPHYYWRLARAEAEADAFWATRAKPSPVRPREKDAARALPREGVIIAALVGLVVIIVAVVAICAAAGRCAPAGRCSAAGSLPPQCPPAGWSRWAR